MESQPIEVLVISQQSLFRQGIKHSLANLPDIEVAGTSDVSEDILRR